MNWRKCSSCKKDIFLNSKYYECSVSTCTGLRTGYVFCSMNCFEVHLPGAKHRSAGAIEKKSPITLEPASEPKRIIISSAPSSTLVAKSNSMLNEVLVVVSKMKQYIKEASDMNTSEDVNFVVSELIRKACDEAIYAAKSDGRKTVMARDFKK